MKTLLGIMHPRRLPFFLNSIKAIDYIDVLLAKNMAIIDAQNAIRTFTLEKGYDALILTSDDVVVPYDGAKQIRQDMIDLDAKIVSGWSPLNPKSYQANINQRPPLNVERRLGRGIFINEYRFTTLQQITEYLKKGQNFIDVWFVGWSLTGMTKEVIEKWTPNGWYFNRASPFVSKHKGAMGFWSGCDLWFSYQTWKLGFKKLADLRVKVIHDPPLRWVRAKRVLRKDRSMLLVGKEPPQTEFIPARKPL